MIRRSSSLRKMFVEINQQNLFNFVSLKETNFLLQLTKHLFNFNIWKISTLLIETNNLFDSICLI